MKMTRGKMAGLLAKAMNLLNDLDRDEWTDRQLGDFHELAAEMPASADYRNNGTVLAREFDR